MLKAKLHLHALALALLIAGSMALLGGPNAVADSDGGIYGLAQVDAGPWSSHFTQSGFGQTASLSSPIGYGIGAHFGFGFRRVSLTYDIAALESVSSVTSAATSTSWAGASLAIGVPVLPIDVYAGFGSGSYAFVTGTSTSFSCAIHKVGAVFRLYDQGGQLFGIRGEYRWYSSTEDQAGALPAGYTTNATAYFLGLTFGWQSGSK